ncbi:NlpC/P60 family protein [Ornithinibacillus bavariensis]|uniref:C40 family peptidase n=1 Tax=Ornithinibacillus bavariensis TaxID=545502 RepID=UPI000EBD99D7|nr:peptidase [Ornithinibacillus sp.]
MYTQTFLPFPDKFHVVAVQVATVWTAPDSPREMDRLAITNPTNIRAWLENQTYEDKVNLCEDNRVQTQALYGEAVLIQEVRGGWAKITIPAQATKKNEQGYPGWIPICQLAEVEKKNWQKEKTAAISVKHIWLKNEQGERELELSFMTCLPVLNVHADSVEVVTPKGVGYLPKEAVKIFPTEIGGEKGGGEAIIRSGENFIGLDYLWGGMSSFGFDCSGFAYTMHKANGYEISRDASDQSERGQEIPFDKVMPGDLLFFAYQEGDRKGYVHHVGFYYGDGRMLHSPQTGKGIEITNLKDTKYEKELCIARRYWF